MKLIRLFFSLCVIVLMSSITTAQQKYDFEKLFIDLPFEMKMPVIPSFPDKEFNIKNYGAIGDGLVMNTDAFAKAIDDCNKNGGGRVVVPAGIWLTGPIHFKSNVNLYLETGAHIQFSKNFDDYPLIESNWEGYDQYRCTSPLMAKDLQNIAITGNGIIDGAGDAWRFVKKSKLNENEWKALVKSGGVVGGKGIEWWPSAEARDAVKLLADLKKQNKTISREDAEKHKLFFRPVLLSFVNCKNVWLDGVTFQNSAAWNLHPLWCENVIVSNVNVRNPWYSQNGDGIDVESCKNVIIYNSRFDVGDDAICMKSGRDAEGRQRGLPTENVVIADCVVYHGHGGFTIGSEMSGGVRNIKITNCNFIGTDIGLRFKSTRGRGGIVENIYIDNIFMKDIPTDALSFNMYYGGFAPADDAAADQKSLEAKLVDVNEETPIFRNIYMDNIVCNGAKDAVVLQGLPEMPITGIEIKNLFMKAERGISMFDAEGIKIENVKMSANDPVVRINQSKNVTIDNLSSDNNNKIFVKLEGAKTDSILLKGSSAKDIKNKIEIGKEVSEKALSID